MSDDNDVKGDGADDNYDLDYSESRTKKAPPTDDDGGAQISFSSGPKKVLEADDEGPGLERLCIDPWKGAIVAPTDAPKNVYDAPIQTLEVEWAYGYRGYDSRSNLVYNAAGKLVYPVAGLVVTYDSKDNSQQHFLGHNDDVVCLAQHPKDTNIIVTGQVAIVDGRSAEPHICIHDTEDRKQTWKIEAAGKRAIRAVAFSSSGDLLASVGDDDQHTVAVWDWKTGSKIAELKGDGNKIFQVKWSNKNENEFATVGDKHVYFWTLSGSTLTKKKASIGTEASWQTYFTVCYSESGFPLCGGADGSISKFSAGALDKVWPKEHKGKVFALDTYTGGLVSGGSDKVVNVYNKKMAKINTINFSGAVKSVYIRDTNLLVGTFASDIFEVKGFSTSQELTPIVSGHWDGESWALAISNNSKSFITAGEDNKICVWDMATHKLLRSTVINSKRGLMPKVAKAATTGSFPPNQCARAIAISPDGKQFIVGCNSGEVQVFDTKSLDKVTTQDLNKHGKRNVANQQGNWIQTIKYSPSGKTCAVGTHGMVVCLLDVADGYKPKGFLKSHNAFITHMDWSADGKHMQTNCGAYELLFHNIDESDLKSAAQNTSASALKDVKWATQTCIYGWPVQGIFDPSQNGSDVNSCDVSPSKTLVVTGDDYGAVNLFRYPVAEVGNEKRSFNGHSSHVVTVRFSPDEKHVISSGGNDKALIQWKVVQ